MSRVQDRSFDADSIASTGSDSSKKLGSLLRRTFATKKRDSAIGHVALEAQDLYFPPEIWQRIYCQLPPGAQACLAVTCRDLQRIVGRSSFEVLRTNQIERLHFLRRLNISSYINDYFLCHNCGLFHELSRGRGKAAEKCSEVKELVSAEFTSRRCVRSGGFVTLYPGYDLNWWMVQIAMNIRRTESQRAVRLLEQKTTHKDGIWKSAVKAKVYKGKLYLCVKTWTTYSANKPCPRGIPHCPHVTPTKLEVALDNAWLSCRPTGAQGDSSRRESTISIGSVSLSFGGDKSRRESVASPLPDRSRRQSAWAPPPEMSMPSGRRQSTWATPPSSTSSSRRESTVAGLPDLSRRGSVVPDMPTGRRGSVVPDMPTARRGSVVTGLPDMSRRGSTMPGMPDLSRRGSSFSPANIDPARRASNAPDPDANNPLRMHIGTLFRCQHCPSEYQVEAQLVSSAEKGKYHIALFRYIDLGEGLSPFENHWPELSRQNVVKKPSAVLKPFDMGVQRNVQARFDGTKGTTFILALD